MLAWIWTNFPAPKLSVKFVPRQYNEEADLLSRWKRGTQSKEPAMEPSREKQTLAGNVSEDLNEYIWNIVHSGHMGMQGMLHIQRKWGIAASRMQLLKRLQACETCKRNYRVYKDTRLGSLNNSVKPNEIIGMDFIGPVDGKYMLVMVDFLSRRVQVSVCKRADRDSVLIGLMRWVQECGPVKKVVSDEGRQFTSEQVRHWCERGAVEQQFLHVYDDRSNGVVKKCNRSVLEALRKIKL